MSQNCCVLIDTDQNEKAKINTKTDCCPTCGQKGKKVDSITIKAMLNVSLLALREMPYLFCRTAACPVVYFSADGLQVFTTDQIRVPVYQKKPNDDTVLVCYCFHHSPTTIRAELLATGTSTVVEAIARGIQADQCACEIRNPQGSCCLGNVQVILEWVQHELGAEERGKMKKRKVSNQA